MQRFGAVLVFVLLASCSPKPASKPQVEFNTKIPINEVMAHVMDPAAYAFWSGSGADYTVKGKKDLSPKTEAEWKHVEDGAATLVVASNALLLPGYAREPSNTWNSHVREVASIGIRAKAAAERKDVAAISDISDELDRACEACHVQFVPSTKGQKPPGAKPPAVPGK